MIRHCETSALSSLPLLSTEEWRIRLVREINEGMRLVALFGTPLGTGPKQLIAVLADDREKRLTALVTPVEEKFSSLTSEAPQAHLFEREIAEQCGIIPEGHPWLKPVRNADKTEFFSIPGQEIHEVAVGPVHAGVIEPGHFRFQCSGEQVFHLEIALGYQHRGVEEALVGGPGKRTIHYLETAAGDTTIGHALAYAQALEGFHGVTPPSRAQALRGIALELERLANHTGDLGALAGDVGFLPTMSFCGRLRGDFLNLTAELCGSRLGRGMIRPGGVGFDLPNEGIARFREKLEAAFEDVRQAADLLWVRPSVMNRFEGIGVLPHKTCLELGIVGLPARACGIRRDIRKDFPMGVYATSHFHVPTRSSGDVFARAYLRWLEILESYRFICARLESLPQLGPETRAAFPELGTPLPASSLIVSLVEGWRGEICHVALTGSDGKLARYKIVDPSFHNWTGLAMALRNQQISDFPLCNKSFNLSYCGHDL